MITAVQAEPDWVEIQTTIVDPRGGTTGSPEAKEAIAICKAGAAMLQSQGTARPNVRVYESNGTTFAYSGKTSNYRCVEY